MTVLQPRTSVPAGPPVTPRPGSPAPEVIVLHPRGPRPDPNRPLIPSREEIEKLPRWARVAYAARCARRLLPLYRQFWPSAPQAHVRNLASAVSLAEQFAASAKADERAAARVSADAEGGSPGDPADITFFISSAVLLARTEDGAHAVALLEALTERMIPLLSQVATVGTARTILAPRYDLDRVSRLAREQKWADDTPVPPEVFGPMWDREPPAWWRDDLLEGLPPQA